jgi:hypothetical protein
MAVSFEATARATTRAWKTCSMNGKSAAFKSDRFNFGGGEYTFNDKRTQVGLWYARTGATSTNSSILNLIHKQPVGRLDAGRQSRLLHWARKTAAQTGWRPGQQDRVMPCFRPITVATPFYLSACKSSSGDDQWMRVNGTSGGTLANDSYNASYDNAQGTLLAAAS